MKNITRLLLLTTLLVSALWSCKKDENKIYFEGGLAPVLTASVTNAIPLTFVTKDNEALKISWTNPEYKFTSGISSQDVSYELQIDTAGANFTNPKKKSLSISKELSYSFTQTELNDYMLNTMELLPGMAHNLEFRVKSSLINNSAILFSNVVKLQATPYSIPPKVAPPASGRLFIVGNATPGEWNNPVPTPNQEFTKVSETLFEITISMKAGSYLFLPVNGSWDAKYGGKGANNSNNAEGDEFSPGGSDMVAPAATGTYKIVVDFQRGRFSVTPQ